MEEDAETRLRTVVDRMRRIRHQTMDEAGMKLRSMIRIFLELEEAGMVERNGKYRQGQPVFVITEYGKAVLDSVAHSEEDYLASLPSFGRA